MIGAHERARIAAALMTAERDRSPIDPPSSTHPSLDVGDAYAIQETNAAARLDAGASLRGRKVGLTSRAMQEMLGVDEPDYGHVFDDMLVDSGGSLRADAFCHPRVEIEVAFVLDAELRGPGVSVADVLRATAFVVPAIEVIDSRIREWRITLADTIADNASSARVVLGGRATPVAGVDLALLGGVLRCNGELVETGASGAVLGNPAHAVAWLANKLAEFGTGLGAGDVVMPGACTRAVDVVAGDAVLGEFDLLGAVGVRFT